jgi:hypothetical protein
LRRTAAPGADRGLARAYPRCTKTAIAKAIIRDKEVQRFTAATMWVNAAAIEPPARLVPEKALSAAAKAGFKDNVLNSYAFGGYLVFKGVPTFIDGRVELFGDQFVLRYFDAMAVTNPNQAAQFLKQHDVHWALLRPEEPIAFQLRADGWAQLYSDDSAIVLAKRS